MPNGILGGQEISDITDAAAIRDYLRKSKYPEHLVHLVFRLGELKAAEKIAGLETENKRLRDKLDIQSRPVSSTVSEWVSP